MMLIIRSVPSWWRLEAKRLDQQADGDDGDQRGGDHVRGSARSGLETRARDSARLEVLSGAVRGSAHTLRV
jgi:hypothetical protein